MAHRSLSLCLAWQDRLLEAQTEAEEAIRLQPDDDYAQRVLGWILAKQGRYQEAEKSFREAIRLNPREPNNFSLLSNLYALRDGWSESADIAREGLRIDPDSVDCANDLAMALLGMERPAEAQAVLNTVMSRDPENCRSHINQGWIHLKQLNIAKTLQHFHEAARIEPENTEVHEFITTIRTGRIVVSTIALLIIVAFAIRYIVQLMVGV